MSNASNEKQRLKKNDSEWQKYLNTADNHKIPFYLQDIPNKYISLPETNKTVIEVWVYDKSGNNSNTVLMGPWVGNTVDPESFIKDN